jgi:hypothetical protein
VRREVAGPLDGASELLREQAEAAYRGWTGKEGLWRRLPGAAVAGANSVEQYSSAGRDVARAQPEAAFQVTGAEHDDHKIDGLVRQEAGHEELFAASKWLQGIVPDRRPAVQALLDDQEAVTELAA